MSLLNDVIGVAINAHQEITGEDGVTYVSEPDATPITLDKPTKTLEPRFLNYQEKLAIETQVIDWIVKAEDFTSGGSFTGPEEGAVIIETGTMIRNYRISRFESEPAWRWLDGSNTHLRIHTVLITEVAA